MALMFVLLLLKSSIESINALSPIENNVSCSQSITTGNIYDIKCQDFADEQSVLGRCIYVC